MISARMMMTAGAAALLAGRAASQERAYTSPVWYTPSQ
jgi:hypothetical protein